MQIDSAAAIGWLLDRAASIAAPPPLPPDQQVTDPDTLSPQDRKAWFDSEKRRIELLEKCGQLCAVDDVRREMAGMVKVTVNLLVTIPDRLELEGLVDGRGVELISRLIDGVREELYQRLTAEEDAA